MGKKKGKKCQPVPYNLIRSSEVYYCFRCIGHGIGGKWFRTSEIRNQAIVNHRAEFQKKSKQK